MHASNGGYGFDTLLIRGTKAKLCVDKSAVEQQCLLTLSASLALTLELYLRGSQGELHRCT
ncbi:hypothetical protein PR001_g33473, partial [Phytophthora rubi]